jgi:hypothetical protein
MAASKLRSSDRHQRQYGVRGLLPHDHWSLQYQYKLLHEHGGGQRTAARFGQRGIRRERRVSIWRKQRIPQPDMEYLELLGGRGLPA